MSELPASQSQVDRLAADLSRISGHLETLVGTSQQIENLLRILAQSTLQSTLREFFKDGKQLRAYELSDGKRSTREIGRLVEVDQKTISTWWRTWEKEHGIVRKEGKRGQFMKLYSLVDLVSMYNKVTTESSEADDHE